ncbi:hypothetical protein [Fodinicola acaciae]|uniref:hypothetical protein n=1 Tax=Fodinicola acaciae TaxID=2681555 RepID=UPI0013D6D913|nr:hypothetical protein [Fodinicola acaciae]
MIAPGSFTVVDNRGRQRFLVDTKKPPIIIGGKTYPPEQRSGAPDDLSCLVFNADNGDEKGAIAVYSTGGIVSLDFANADGVHLETSWEGSVGGAVLQLRHMPDPALPPEQARNPVGAVLAAHSESGSSLQLCDPAGKPRLSVRVAMDGRPSIAFLDERGEVVKEL